MELPVKSPISGDRRVSYRLETKNLSYKLPNRFDELNRVSCGWSRFRKPSKIILNGVNCEANEGEITAIAGPSGAGKTTLLEILAGKIEVSGEVLVNGKPINTTCFRRISGYVTQDDALFPLLTVEETLTYSARFRLRGTRNEVTNRVKVLIKELGLGHVAGSRIGDDDDDNHGSNFGLSGGERRRVSIGADLVHDPAVVLIDEPTSGLDSASALHIMKLLKSMAVDHGKTIVLTIHQPGFRILELFDRVVLLSNGFSVHNGSLKLLEERLKFRIPSRVNILEFSIDIIDRLALESLEPIQPIRNNMNRFSNHDDMFLVSYVNSRLDEVFILGQRFRNNIFRTKQLFATRVIQALATGFILGTIYLNVGNDNRNRKTDLQTRIGFFAFTLTFLLSSTTEGLPIFLRERRILLRETSRGAYRVSSYVIANTVIFLPFLLVIGLLFGSPVYWLVGLRREIDGFVYFSLVVWLVLSMSNSFVACFSALVPNFIVGTSVISGFMGSFFLFSGYFIDKDKIPSYWTFMHYLSLFKYPFECFMINEYGGEDGKKRCVMYDNNGKCSLYGSGFLAQQGIKETRKWSNLAVMTGFVIGYRLLCLLILWYRCYRRKC